MGVHDPHPWLRRSLCPNRRSLCSFVLHQAKLESPEGISKLSKEEKAAKKAAKAAQKAAKDLVEDTAAVDNSPEEPEEEEDGFKVHKYEPPPEPEDETLQCRDCGGDFIFTVGEQEFFKMKGFDNKKTRCADCTAAKKVRAAAAGEQSIPSP
jgi:hypothetical protein